MVCPVCGDTSLTFQIVPEAKPDDDPHAAGGPFHGAATLAPSEAPVEAEVLDLPCVAGYEILTTLGRGGMGVVYKARQVKLNRVVALKMILAGEHAGTDQLERFRIEREAVARLQHPNVVQIYEVGEQDGLPFFSLEYVDGGSLAQKLGGRPQPPRQAAQLVQVLAQAVYAAHQHDIVHRDLKPANVLLTREGIPKITDFGLAKRLDSHTHHTQSGAILGTPSYMAPEQADGKTTRVGPAADIYALGAILYELLTGQPPFQADTPLDTILQVLEQEPIPPRMVQRKTPRDLEVICLKCLQKTPENRYASARELANDLGRFLAGEVIRARPTRAWERIGKWCRRRPSAAIFLGVMVAGGVATLVEVSSMLSQSTDMMRSAAVKVAQITQRSRQGLSAAHDAQGPIPGEAGSRIVFTLPAQQGRRCCLAFSPDGGQLASGGANQAVKIWDMTTGKMVRTLSGHKAEVLGVAYSSDGRRLASAGADRTAKVWDLTSGREACTLLGHAGQVCSVGFSPDGRYLATASGDHTARLWDSTGKAIRTLSDHTDTVHGVAFSPDSRHMTTVGEDGRLVVWDVASGQIIYSRQAPLTSLLSVAFSPDGRRLLTSGTSWGSGRFQGEVKLWNSSDGKEIGSQSLPLPVGGAAFSPDGRRLVGSGGDAALVWNGALRTQLCLRSTRSPYAAGIACSKDSGRLAVADWSGLVQIWNLPEDREEPAPLDK
jgi:WD40 repeat protein/serine/threonine protein kinase